MIHVLPSSENEIHLFVEMEQSEDTSRFIIPNKKEVHLKEFAKSNIYYLSIKQNDKTVGFVILVIDAQSNSVELRRIVVASKGLGIGQEAILKIEGFVMEVLSFNRIWLDVFESNSRGKHIYEKLGYKEFKRSLFEGAPLILMEKLL